jgi:hypothetical protein
MSGKLFLTASVMQDDSEVCRKGISPLDCETYKSSRNEEWEAHEKEQACWFFLKNNVIEGGNW